MHVAWPVLPHRAADVNADDSVKLKNGTAKVDVENDSKVLDGEFDLFALTGTSPRSATPIPGPGDSSALIDLRAVGVREVSPGTIQFGIDTFGSRSHPAYPAEFDILIDRDNDGDTDVVVFTAENGAAFSSGQTVVFVDDLAVPGAVPALLLRGRGAELREHDHDRTDVRHRHHVVDEVQLLRGGVRQLLHRGADGLRSAR